MCSFSFVMEQSVEWSNQQPMSLVSYFYLLPDDIKLVELLNSQNPDLPNNEWILYQKEEEIAVPANPPTVLPSPSTPWFKKKKN